MGIMWRIFEAGAQALSLVSSLPCMVTGSSSRDAGGALSSVSVIVSVPRPTCVLFEVQHGRLVACVRGFVNGGSACCALDRRLSVCRVTLADRGACDGGLDPANDSSSGASSAAHDRHHPCVAANGPSFLSSSPCLRRHRPLPSPQLPP